jgi:HKD family nuclease
LPPEVDKAVLAARPYPPAPHARPLITGGTTDPLLPHLHTPLAWATQVDIAVASMSASGVVLLFEHLRDVIQRGGQVRILIGDYLDVTEPDALRRLLDLGDGLQLRIVETTGASFHVKSYVCIAHAGHGAGAGAGTARDAHPSANAAFAGSSNLTRTSPAGGRGLELPGGGPHR